MARNVNTLLRRIGVSVSKVPRDVIRKNNRKRMMKRYTATEGYEFMNKAQNEIFLGASDIPDYFLAKISTARDERGMETFYVDFGIYCTKNEWSNYLHQLQDLRLVQSGNNHGYMFDDEGLNYIRYDIHSTHITITLTGDYEFAEEYTEFFEKDFEFVTNQIEWLYSNDGNSIEIPLRHDRLPVEEMYPFLEGESLEDYYTNFMKSNASILLLIGPPGTGKTTFIRGLLQQTNSSAMVSYDANVLEKDYVFANFIEGNKSVMVLEDADMFLKSRKEGNTMMHKFLNVGDGLVTTRNKKLIFSTNLPSISDIDPALIRPGRCYDILHFSELDQKQAENLAKRCNTTLNGKKDKWSIADVFYNQNTNQSKLKGLKTVERKMGFV